MAYPAMALSHITLIAADKDDCCQVTWFQGLLPEEKRQLKQMFARTHTILEQTSNYQAIDVHKRLQLQVTADISPANHASDIGSEAGLPCQ